MLIRRLAAIFFMTTLVAAACGDSETTTSAPPDTTPGATTTTMPVSTVGAGTTIVVIDSGWVEPDESAGDTAGGAATILQRAVAADSFESGLALSLQDLFAVAQEGTNIDDSCWYRPNEVFSALDAAALAAFVEANGERLQGILDANEVDGTLPIAFEDISEGALGDLVNLGYTDSRIDPIPFLTAVNEVAGEDLVFPNQVMFLTPIYSFGPDESPPGPPPSSPPADAVAWSALSPINPVGTTNSVEGDTSPAAVWGHGVFVAGVAQAVAPGADIAVFSATDGDGAMDEGSVIAALTRARDAGHNHANAVTNLSLGTYPCQGGGEGLLRAIREYLGSGEDDADKTVITAAAGNEGFADHVMFPASLGPDEPCLVSVGTDAAFSNKGDRVEALAPGTDIVSAYPNAEGLATWSGTSFAAPHVAGYLAAQGGGCANAFNRAAGEGPEDIFSADLQAP